ncbi:hypothetical protein V5O48_002713 [Marasmius crinis-equi]|uniref:Glycosyl transferase CAP10 domain-containing protein n=1 Tax=Marasmius crinis-equi TaxID=585013 RepID=A0ABR3FUY9_9AGAR
MSLTSPRTTRFVKYLVAAFILWQISAKTSYFFHVSVSVDQTPQFEQEELTVGDGDGSQYTAQPEYRQPEYHDFLDDEGDIIQPHHYHTNGFLEVNPAGGHPILELLERAEKEWKEKLARASKSLDEAVREYKRRYKRDPPKGFDKWWDYVEKHHVQLPDEYDQIHEDLQPFWGISPPELLEIQRELEAKKDSYTIGKNETSGVAVVRTSFQEGRYAQLIKGTTAVVDLLKDIEEYLPTFRATFSPHDGPNRLSDFEVRDAAVQAASVGARQSYHFSSFRQPAHAHNLAELTRKSLPRPTSLGWLSACPPTSPAGALRHPFTHKHNGRLNLDSLVPPSSESPIFPYPSSSSFRYPNVPSDTPHTKTFIFDHHKTMDPCNNPTLFWTHGQFLGHDNPSPEPHMVPEFSPCTTMIHHNIHIPTPYAWMSDLPAGDNPDWELREDERLMWRGSNTGIGHGKATRWKYSHRDWLVRWASETNGTVDVLFSGDDGAVGGPKAMRRARLNPSMIDASFAGKLQCWDDETCKALANLYTVSRRMSAKEAGNYKYVLDVDGNGWSGRFKRLITSKALVFKATVYPEWYTSRIQPWVHYVPVQVDLSDLYDVLMFFRGDPNGNGAHDDLAKRIALEGRRWSQTFWRREDLVAYFFRLMLEYTRVMSPNREELSYLS